MKSWRFLAIASMLLMSACTPNAQLSLNANAPQGENVKGFIVPNMSTPQTTASWEKFKTDHVGQMHDIYANLATRLVTEPGASYPQSQLDRLNEDLKYCALTFEDCMSPMQDALFASTFVMEDMQALGVQQKYAKEYAFIKSIFDTVSPLCTESKDIDDYLHYYGDYIQRCMSTFGIQIQESVAAPSPSMLDLNKSALKCASLALSNGNDGEILEAARISRGLVDEVEAEHQYSEFTIACLSKALDKIIARLGSPSATNRQASHSPAAEASPTPRTDLPTQLAAGTSPQKADVSIPKSPELGQEIITPSGLRLKVTKAGTGKACKPGDTVCVNYTGSFLDGTVFDSSYERNHPLNFPLGDGHVIDGWDAGIPGMKVGEKRHLVIPPALGYGDTGSGPIPPNATLVFDIELVDIK